MTCSGAPARATSIDPGPGTPFKQPSRWPPRRCCCHWRRRRCSPKHCCGEEARSKSTQNVLQPPRVMQLLPGAANRPGFPHPQHPAWQPPRPRIRSIPNDCGMSDRSYPGSPKRPHDLPRELLCGGALVAVFALLAWLSWRTWPDILVDFGQELYVPWRLAERDVLYKDVAWVTGPLSQYANALLFRLFGVSLTTLIFA